MNKEAIWKIRKPFGSKPPEEVKKDKFKPLKMNINTTCRVKLTEHGIEWMNKKAPHNFTCSGWRGDTKEFTTELWTLMSVFGECMWMGNNKMPFVGNKIEIMEEL